MRSTRSCGLCASRFFWKFSACTTALAAAEVPLTAADGRCSSFSWCARSSWSSALADARANVSQFKAFALRRLPSFPSCSLNDWSGDRLALVMELPSCSSFNFFARTAAGAVAPEGSTTSFSRRMRWRVASRISSSLTATSRVARGNFPPAPSQALRSLAATRPRWLAAKTRPRSRTGRPRMSAMLDTAFTLRVVEKLSDHKGRPVSTVSA